MPIIMTLTQHFITVHGEPHLLILYTVYSAFDIRHLSNGSTIIAERMDGWPRLSRLAISLVCPATHAILRNTKST